MSVSRYSEIEIKKELEERFLYQDDVDALDLLLAIIDNNQKCNSMKPKYICSSRIKRSLRRMLHFREDKDLIISAIMQAIHNDINRLELSIYLDYYTEGYDYKEGVDLLEREVLKRFSVDSLSNRKKLYHDSDDPSIKLLKKTIINNSEEGNIRYINRRLIKSYCDKTMKDKIMQLNTSMNKQLRFYYDSNNIYIHDEMILTKKFLDNIYNRILRTFSRGIMVISFNAIWYGVNDRVLERYK